MDQLAQLRLYLGQYGSSISFNQAWEPAAGEVMTDSYAVCMKAAQQTAAGIRIGAMGIEVVFHAFWIPYIAHLDGADEFGSTPKDFRWIAAPM